MGILEFMSDSPVLTVIILICVFAFIESMAKIIKGKSDE